MKGLFIAIEGTYAADKDTQLKLLRERLIASGYNVSTFNFPRHNQPSGFFVKEYLDGQYGSPDEVSPYTASLFYALDRYQAAPQIRKALSEGSIVLANHYTASNMALQGARFDHPEQRRGYFVWLDNLEHQMFGIPRPDISIVLRVPPEIAYKQNGNNTDNNANTRDRSAAKLKRFAEVYDDICKLFPKDFSPIDCVKKEEPLSITAINNRLWAEIERLLPPKPKRKAGRNIVNEVIPQNPYVTKHKDGTYSATSEGEEFLRQSVTSLTDNVYAFKDKLSPMTIAAAMARLSRRGDDMRITILDEFAASEGKDDKLLQKVITAYGDDSVQQLAAIHLVVEGASNLLTKKLEWGRLAAYLEQSTRYIYFDQKDIEDKYKYYTPQNLDKKTEELYRATMDQIFDLYSMMVHKLTDYVRLNSKVPKSDQDSAWHSATRAQACDAVRSVLPVATKSTVGIFASRQALESLVTHLLSDELSEAKEVGQKLIEHARQVIPAFLERADKPDRGGAVTAYRANTFKSVSKLADKYLSAYHSDEAESVQLVSVWPRNEMDLVPDMLYEHSNLPLKKIQKEVAGWPYEQKLSVFHAYMGERLNRRHKPGRALEKAHYSWDLVCDYGIFRDLQRHRMVDDLEWQLLTPRYGYETPALVEEAGLDEVFQTCFELSLKLYSVLQQDGHNLEAQYATLLGHKMRWKVTYNAREAFHLHELRTSPQGHPGYRKLVLQMHEKLGEVHPMLAEAMKFVDKGEDPELTRLAAERYTKHKLSQITDKE